MRLGWTILAATALMAASPALGDIARRVQVVYDPVGQAVTRLAVGVVDPHPGLGLDFLWEPARGNWPGVDADGLASGAGVLTWRIPGTASYDPRAVYERFEGSLKAGAFDGAGVLVDREGRRWEGNWAAGLLEGQGSHMDAEGNLYQGAFRAGLAEGQGTLRSREGWIYTGGFQAGLRHGEGHMALPGGQQYDVVMAAGVEVRSTRPAEITDSTLGGLLPAQGGGDAGKVTISVVTDQRAALGDSIVYTHFVDGENLLVYPSDNDLTDSWNGTGKLSIPYQFLELSRMDWETSRAYLAIGLATSGGAKVTLKDLRLVVDQSAPHLRPMLDAVGHSGCIGYRPDFHFVNYGWGAVENPDLKLRFMNPDQWDYERPADEQGEDRAWVAVPVSGFDAGLDVDLSQTFRDLGVDTATLAGNRFSCPSVEMSDTCNANLQASVDFGQLAGKIGRGANVPTLAIGELSYDWRDSAGAVQHQVENFAVWISLARIETGPSGAEMGAGGAYFAAAPEFQDIALQTEGAGYSFDLPIRGNPKIESLTSRVKLWSERSALHTMHVEAAFADGSVRSSMPIYLFYLSPREATFRSAIQPKACFLGTDF